MKKLLMPVWAMSLTCAFAAPMVSDLKVTSVEPLGVAIDYVVSGASEIEKSMPIEVSMSVNGTNHLTNHLAKTLIGATDCEDGTHRIYWNMAKDGLQIGPTNALLTVTYKYPRYCVIDLSGGSDADFYPVVYMNEPPRSGFTDESYKTEKLVLKRIEPDSFTMGNSGVGDNQPHDVTLTHPFYMGLYEVTQKQWELVMGANNVSLLSSHGKGDAYPAYGVSYRDIRGSSNGSMYPATNAVDASSFLGKLRMRTGLGVDLPTEAQWEYACRAGKTTAYGYGNDVKDDNGGEYMWYSRNSSSTAHEVGTRLPNDWGFYDMHGNVWEWCLDWYSSSMTSADSDPKGSPLGVHRVKRGGGWRNNASCCMASFRLGYGPSFKESDYGFRLAWTLPFADPDAVPATEEFSLGRICADGRRIERKLSLGYAPRKAVVKVNGDVLTNAVDAGHRQWEATKDERQVVVSHRVGDDEMSATYSISAGITLSPAKLSVGATRSTSVVKVKTIAKGSEEWTAETTADWLTLSRTSGEGSMNLAVAAAENVAAEERIDYVSVAGQKLEVTQKGRGAVVTNSVTVAPTGGEVAVRVSVTNETTTWCTRSWTPYPWIQVETTGGTGSGDAKLRVLPWNRTKPRDGAVTIAGKPVRVTQNAAEAKVSKNEAKVKAQGEKLAVDVETAACVEWELVDVPEWIVLKGEKVRTGTNTVEMSVAPNETFESRKATILIADKMFAVTQDAAKIEVGGTNQTADVCIDCPVEGTNLLVSVRVDVATAPWTVEIPKGTKDNWVFLMSGDDPVSGDGSFELYVAPMPQKENERKATVKIGNVTNTIRQKWPPKEVAVKEGANDAAKPQVTGPSSTTNAVSATKAEVGPGFVASDCSGCCRPTTTK